MSNELVVIEEGTALQVLTSEDQVQKLIDEVQFKVDNLDGGTMETGVGRKKIISNANKAKKSKTALNKIIDDLINQEKTLIEEKTKGEQAKISALKASKIQLGEGLDNIYKSTRQKVTDFEDELKRQKEQAEAKARQIEIDNAHELAILMNEKFDKELEELRLIEEENERKYQEQLAKEQAQREEGLKRQAAEQARLDAERKAKEEADRLRREKEAAEAKAEAQRQAAIQAEIDAENARIEAENQKQLAEKQRIENEKRLEEQKREAEAKAKFEAEQAELRRIEQEKEAKLQAELAEQRRIEDAKRAEEKRLADIEAARQSEILRQQQEKEAADEARAQREANTRYVTSKKTELKEAIIALGVDEESAIKVVKAAFAEQLPVIQINY